MRYLIILIAVFLYADISDILLKVRKLEKCGIYYDKTPNIFMPESQPQSYTKPEVVYQAPTQEINVKAIMNDMVFINSKWYKKGERIGEYLILNFNRKYLYLKKDNKVITIPILEQKVIK